jgi:predicted TIM-barrel fold metal-dependent hydrolase
VTDISRIPIIDVDSHLTEPADLWTSRVPDNLKDQVPHVRWNEDLGEAEWWCGGLKLSAVGAMSMAGWPEYMPSRPKDFSEIDDGMYTAKGRLRKLDEFGIQAQILFPNIMGFYTQAFLNLEPEVALRCVRVYNDFQAEFADADPDRLLPVIALPFWDVEASVAELDRCADMGFRSLLFASTFERIGLPGLVDPHWDPLLKRAEERSLPLNFHVGFSMFNNEDFNTMVKSNSVGFNRNHYAKQSVNFLLGNVSCIAELAMSGIAVRYPDLKFVSVESGFGYLPFLLEAMDWQWQNSGAHLDNPGHPLPSEVVQRQIFATFWFERECFDLLPVLQDNVMFASDYPHPTSLSPGEATIAEDARTTAISNLSNVEESIARKVLCENACKLFNLPVPADLQPAPA